MHTNSDVLRHDNLEEPHTLSTSLTSRSYGSLEECMRQSRGGGTHYIQTIWYFLGVVQVKSFKKIKQVFVRV